MVGLLAVGFPLALLLFMLFMERVERPLRTGNGEAEVEEFFDHARPDEVDTFVRFGLRRGLDKLRRRRHRRPVAARSPE